MGRRPTAERPEVLDAHPMKRRLVPPRRTLSGAWVPGELWGLCGFLQCQSPGGGHALRGCRSFLRRDVAAWSVVRQRAAIGEVNQ